MIRVPTLTTFILMGCAALALGQSKPQTGGLTFKKDIRPLLEKYCWDCHGDGAKKGDLALDSYADETAIAASRKIWDGVHFNIDNWLMPPAKKEQPTAVERERLAQFIDAVLNPYDPANPDPGRVTVRRLNRTEYNNTVRDLLGVDIKPAGDFPEDDTGYGFDTIGDVLTLPPILMERYLIAAERVLDAAIPEGPPPSKKFTFDAGNLRGKKEEGGRQGKNYALTDEGTASVDFDFPATGEYIFRAKLWASQAGPEKAKAEIRAEGAVLVKSAEISGTADKPQMMEGRAMAQKGSRRVGVKFLNDYFDEKQPADRQDRNLYILSFEIEGPTKADPEALPNEVSKRIFAIGQQQGETEAGARSIMQNFANRAFRRAAQPAEIDRLMTIFKLAQKKNEPFRECLKMGMQATMISPYFLYRIEWQPEANNAQRVVDLNEFSLAARLSYFLWSSMPDDELLSLAFRNELRKNLSAQVERMLKDPKARALSQNFAGQWLETRTLDVVQPDIKRFRFPGPLREAMKRETEEFFWHIQQENRSVMEFLTANYTYVNERLARHYGILNVTGDDFRKVTLPPESLRRGVLTHGSVLTLTSDPTRTSPVKRGKWITENILGISPPPPPPNVPPLDDEKKGEITGTVRQRLEQHRSNAACASCHSLIDPVGFGLENFDAIGSFRTMDSGQPVDTTGILTTGQKFANVFELTDIIVRDRPENFQRCLVKKLMTYALGRGMQGYDKPAIDGILARMKKENNTFRSMIAGIIDSVPFQKRRGDAGRPEKK